MTVANHKSSEDMKFGTSLKLQATMIGGQPCFKGHVILTHLVLDDEGNICLTSPTGLNGMLGAIDELKRELDKVASHAVLWLARNITLDRARFDLVPDGGVYEGGVSKGDGGYVCTPSPPHVQGANIIPFMRS